MARPTRKMVNLSIEETSGVDHPAHLHEGWLVMKSASSEDVEKAMSPRKTEDGVEFPAEAFAYVPDPEKPSSWKLRLWETPEDKATARQVGMAVAALGEGGFRGNKVQIPAGDLDSVKEKVRAAWKRVNPDAEEVPSVLKSTKEVAVDAQKEDMGDGEEKPSYEDLMAKLKKAEDRIAEMEKEYGDKMKKSAVDEDVMKSASAEVREAFELMQKQARDAQIERDAVEETLRKERAERADAEAVVKARESYGSLGLDASVVGPALRRLADSDADLAKSVESVLAAANAKVESADIFSEIGKSRPTLGGAYERAEALAKAAVAGGSSATFEQALTDVFGSNPDLYSQYRAEQAGR